MINYIPVLITAAALIYGGIIDFRRREIPDSVPILLLISGLFGFSVIWSILGLVAPTVLLLATAKITKNDVPGGDFKLLAALGFASGLPELAAILLLAGIGTVVYSLVRHLPLKRHIPLCAYVAPAYIALHIVALALCGGEIM